MSRIEKKWKYVPEYDKRYKVSNHGEIMYRTRGNNPTAYNLSIAKPNTQGYNVFKLRKDQSDETVYIHILVARLFIPNPENKPVVNHKDGIKTHNWVDNLEWATYKENSQHYHDTK